MVKNVVIWEHENFRHEKKYQIMVRTKTRTGLYHVFPGVCFTKDEAIAKCAEKGYNVETIGTFYHVI